MKNLKREMAQKENKLSKIDKTILDNFYKLVHTNQNVRLRASLSTYRILIAMKKNRPNLFNEHLNYCVERLVTGLASSRACARRGYATLLLEILKNYQVSTERLISIAQQKFGNITNETNSDNLLGYFLLIVIIIDSGNYKRSKQNASLLEKMFKQLIHLKNIKSYFDYPVSKLLSEHYELFYPYLLANISPESLGTGTKVTHTELLILVLCNKKQPMRELIGLDSASVANLSTCLTSDRLQRRPLHPIWLEYSKILIAHMPQQFESFCNNILSPTFFKPNHNDLASMGLELIASLLGFTTEPSLIKAILSDYVIRLLILSQRSKGPLRKNCMDFFKTLNSQFEASLKSEQEEEKIDERQFNILNRLTTSPGSVAFDEDSKSSSISNLLDYCQPNVLDEYINKLIAIMNKRFALEEAKRLHKACARQLSHIIHRPQMMERHETALRLAKFSMVNFLFEKVNGLTKDKKSDFWSSNDIPPPIEHLDSTTKEALVSTYHSALDHLTSACSTLERIEKFGQLIDFTDRLLKIFSVECCEQNAELKNLWPIYQNSLSNHRKLIKKNQDSKLLYPITNLYLFYGLQIIEHGLSCKAQLDELSQSSEEALKNDPNDGSWADVLTDQILAILSATECSPWIRKLCVSIFGSLLAHISETSIDLINDALTASLSSEEDESDEEGSDSPDTNESEYSSEDSVDADEEASSDDEIENRQSDEEESDREDEHQMSVDAEKKLNRTNSTQATTMDGESDEEEEYLNDDQMMELDSVIADMFKLNRVGNKNKRDPSFQLRVLDLVKKILAKKRNDTEVVKKILASLGPLANKTRKSPELRPISDKIAKMVAKMPKKDP